MDYQQLRAWRDVCEFLNSQWYKFGDSLRHDLPHIDQTILEPAHRFQLWDKYQIQLIRWGEHPACNFSRSMAREFRKDRGWTLVFDWESKINFLEQMVLFDRDPATISRPWVPGLERRIRERYWNLWQHEERDRRCKLSKERLEQEYEFRESLDSERLAEIDRIQFEQWMFFQRASKTVLIANGRCPHCKVEAIPLMLDCVNCGKSLEIEE